MKNVYAVFYFGWPGQGFKGVGTTEDLAASIIDHLIERGEVCPGQRYEGGKFSIVPVQANSVEINGVVRPVLRVAEAAR
jgi:hypothetical protein